MDHCFPFLPAAAMNFSTSNSEGSCGPPSYTDDESPFISHFHKPRVQFLEMDTEASSSDSSLVLDKVKTPQFFKRFRKEFAHWTDVNDKLEKELSDQIKINSEKEGLMVQPSEEKTMFRYYCEAILILGHFQRPGAVEGVTIRRTVQTDVAANFTEQQKASVAHYMANSNAVANQHYRMKTLDAIVATSNLLSSLTRSSSDDSGDEGTQAVKRRRVEEEVGSPAPDFNAFLQAFPVGITGQPPNKTQREKAGFPGDRVFYDKWRALQYSLREQHLLSKFSRRTPTAAMVAKVIDAEGWTANHPRPEDIMAKWRPLSRAQAESDPGIIKGVTRQKWSGLAVKDFGEQKGVVATKAFGKGSILCDFHGKVITGAEGREMAETQDQLGNLFFFKHGPDEICIDAETFPCECHPSLETIGRWITHSKKKCNVQPCHCIVKLQGGDGHVLLFQATTDIQKDDKICFDHGIKKRTFRGEIEELEWLDI
ncbi:nuclear mitotic apparatus protein [Pimephales promelas]|nr:nuclear mitotic apparatus protein [Pimephales promelas]